MLSFYREYWLEYFTDVKGRNMIHVVLLKA